MTEDFNLQFKFEVVKKKVSELILCCTLGVGIQVLKCGVACFSLML